MARSDKLYTNPRSKAGDEPDKREAKKGDVKRGKDIDVHDADEEAEYESIGTGSRDMDDPEAVPLADSLAAGRAMSKPGAPNRDTPIRIDRKNEWWRKRERPTS